MGQFSCPGRPKILVPPRLVVLEMKNLTKNCTNTLQCAMGKQQFMLYGLSVNQLAHQKNSGPKWPPRRLQKLQTKIVACTRNLRAILLFFTMFY